jgi:glycine betaine/proline transport system substrate-binding protein
LKTIGGILANPQLVGGPFNNCPVGTGCRVSNDNLIKAFELERHGIKIFNHGSLETLATSIASAYTNKEPWFGYYWAPTAVLGKYHMVAVDMGPIKPDVAACNARRDCATPGQTGWPPGTVLTAVTPAFAARDPEIVELLKHVQFRNDVMGKLLAWQEDNKATADEVAAYFLTNYKDVWKDWLSQDARKKLSAVLN